MKNETKKLTQKELEAKALIAGDLLREGEVTRVETFRVEMDAALGENTGDFIEIDIYESIRLAGI